MEFLGENLFEEKVFPEPFSQTFLSRKNDNVQLKFSCAFCFTDRIKNEEPFFGSSFCFS